MNELNLTPRSLNSPLVWPGFVYELQEALAEIDETVYLVGGAVRDAYLRRLITDLDLATTGSGLRLARWIANRFGGAYFPLDEQRDVGRAILHTADGRLVIDAARLRGGNLGDDLRDRDFTLNAMAVDLRGDLNQVIDPLNGAEDLAAKRLRQCAQTSLRSDPIRCLRAVRFSVQFNLRMEADTLKAVREEAWRLVEPSAERLRDEWFKMLSLPRPASVIRVADSLGLIGLIMPEVLWLKEAGRWAHAVEVAERMYELWQTISPLRTDESAANFRLGMVVIGLDRFRAPLQGALMGEWPDERPHRALLVFAALLHEIVPAQAEARAAALRLSRDERERIMTIIRLRERFSDAADDAVTIYRFWRDAGKAGVDVILLALADLLASAGLSLEQEPWLRAVEQAQRLLHAYFEARETLVDPPALIDGNDLLQVGIPRGPLIGEILERIREAQVAGVIRSRDEALAFARAAGRGG